MCVKPNNFYRHVFITYYCVLNRKMTMLAKKNMTTPEGATLKQNARPPLKYRIYRHLDYRV